MKQPRQNCLIAVSGCTGSGKSDLGIAIAKEFNGEVVSADSMQIYQGLDIVTNKVTECEMDGIPHHLMSFRDPRDTGYNVHMFRESALDLLDDIWQREKLPVIVGGTAYYLEAVLYSDNLIQSDPSKIEHIREEISKLTAEELYTKLQEVDPEAAALVHRNNKYRVQRALEIFLVTGRRKSEFLKEQRLKNDTELGGRLRFPNTLLFNLDADTQVLDHRLNERVEKMVARGLRKEVEEFYDTYVEELGTHGIMQSIGLKEFLPYLKLDEARRRGTEGNLAFIQGCEDLQLHTRQYSRKQRNWLSQRILKRSKIREIPTCFTLDTTTHFYDRVIPCASELTSQFISGADMARANRISDVIREPPNDDEFIEGNYQQEANRVVHCEICSIDVQGTDQWQQHVDGKKHKALLQAQKKAASQA